ncbi:integrase core domain-containing protein, partial [Brachybacterium tyrofermentans]
EPVDPTVRLAISRWPDDAPRGSVSTFCVEHGISRKTFYVLRARARVDGPAAVLEPRTKRPHTSPGQLDEEVKDQAVQVRAALEASGLDHGPISVHDRMKAMGLEAPSIAALARIFRERGVARLEPRKRPRASWRRFVYPAPNACWQLDATQYVLTNGRTCVIFQLQDDHSRLAVASHVAGSETAEAAIAVFNKGTARCGTPQRLLTDNGAALNPTRRGMKGQLVIHVTALGVEAITGKPYKPTTQGKNERFHQTLFRWLDKQPIAGSIEELQAQVDEFDVIYNEQRPHQGLPGRITPRQAWDATEPAPSPRPVVEPSLIIESVGDSKKRSRKLPRERVIQTGERTRVVNNNGTITLHGVAFQVSYPHAQQEVHVLVEQASVTFVDLHGEILAEHAWPPLGIRYASKHTGQRSGKRRGRPPKNPEPSPMS